ncbi:CBS domain-containing protein [Vulgatibacter sp.]|uniref:CBS domain-containing protein n=1 Tax=Vulgatibacter sp. TaxID=1971226 RepID=UPI0035619162
MVTRVRDLMTRDVVTLDVDESLLLADDVMRLGRIRHLPVVRGGTLVGLVSHRDMLRASVSSLAGLSRSEEASIKRAIPVRECMAREVVTVGPDETALGACKLILDRKLGCLPVVDDQRRLVGILTEADFVQLARRYLEEDRA